jgi:hypothetical protein
MSIMCGPGSSDDGTDAHELHFLDELDSHRASDMVVVFSKCVVIKLFSRLY